MKKKIIVNIVYLLITISVTVIVGMVNIAWMMANDFIAEFPNLLFSLLFLFVTVIYLLKVDLKWTIPIIIFWIPIILYGVGCILVKSSIVYVFLSLMLFMPAPLFGISYLVDSFNSNLEWSIMGILYIVISLLILSIPTVRYIKHKRIDKG